ncbi:unnamed protein product, partial [Ectocarpus sp. 8 AP-2014]
QVTHLRSRDWKPRGSCLIGWPIQGENTSVFCSRASSATWEQQVLLRGMSPTMHTSSSSSSSGSSPEGGEGLLEGNSVKNEAEQKSLMQQQRQVEVLSLRERG